MPPKATPTTVMPAGPSKGGQGGKKNSGGPSKGTPDATSTPAKSMTTGVPDLSSLIVKIAAGDSPLPAWVSTVCSVSMLVGHMIRCLVLFCPLYTREIEWKEGWRLIMMSQTPRLGMEIGGHRWRNACQSCRVRGRCGCSITLRTLRPTRRRTYTIIFSGPWFLAPAPPRPTPRLEMLSRSTLAKPTAASSGSSWPVFVSSLGMSW
jgi:hypothetical protein